jgi:hypothetical protein
MKRTPGTSILSDEVFRRTATCSYFEKRITQRMQQLPELTKEARSVDGADVCLSWMMKRGGFCEPFLVPNSNTLGIKLPPSSTTLSEIAAVVGPQTPINLIEVGTQMEISGVTLGDYAYYLENRSKHHKTVNLISLEISTTPLNSRVAAPRVVREELDWVDLYWPLERRAKGDYPRVQKYCLCGMAGSYTDFHVDFGGTSVWYNVVWGKKVFFLIRPSVANLNTFLSWSCSRNQDEVFFGDLLAGDSCYQVTVEAGQTLFLPSGWIHAVYTPVDSLVFGGNYLHNMAILTQLQTFVLETRTHIGSQYRFPYFKAIHWLALCSLVGDLDDDGESLQELLTVPQHLLSFGCLVRTMKLWTTGLGSVDGSDDMRALTEFTTISGLNSTSDVCQRWETALLALADGLDNKVGISNVQSHVSFRNRMETVLMDNCFDVMSESWLANAGLLCPSTPDPEISVDAGPIQLSAANIPEPKATGSTAKQFLKIKKFQIVTADKQREQQQKRHQQQERNQEIEIADAKSHSPLTLKLQVSQPGPASSLKIAESSTLKRDYSSANTAVLASTTGQPAHRTRGNRVSADMLRFVADYAVEDEVQNSYAGSATLSGADIADEVSEGKEEVEEEHKFIVSDGDDDWSDADSDSDYPRKKKLKSTIASGERSHTKKSTIAAIKRTVVDAVAPKPRPQKTKQTIRQMLMKKMGH